MLHNPCIYDIPTPLGSKNWGDVPKCKLSFKVGRGGGWISPHGFWRRGQKSTLHPP